MDVIKLPWLICDNDKVARAFRVALGDIVTNLVIFQEGQLTEPKLCLGAGLNYSTVWTRDNSVNTFNMAGLFLPEVAENSLRAVLTEDTTYGGWRIGGQYWDAIIWAMGVWEFYLYRGNKDFLVEALDIVERSLRFFEDTEFDSVRGLFRGAAFFQDGISAYPDELSNNFGSDVRNWVDANPATRNPKGFGIPWFALSTNCLYARAYQIVNEMRKELELPLSADASARAEALRKAISDSFWNSRRGTYDYLILPDGRKCEHQEGGAGIAFAILFDIADAEKIKSILRSVQIMPEGIPCVCTQFPRFAAYGAGHYGRHSGTVWPQIQAFWARAALKAGDTAMFDQEFARLVARAARDGQFTEIYHPVTGLPYGGIQEDYNDSHLILWESVPNTTWGATSYCCLIHKCILGLECKPEGIHFRPHLPKFLSRISLTNIPYRNTLLHVELERTGHKGFALDGKSTAPLLSSNTQGEHRISITV